MSLYTKPYLTQLHNDEYAILMVEYYVSAEGYAATFHEPGSGDEIEMNNIYKHDGPILDSYFEKIPNDIRMVEYDDIDSRDYDDAWDWVQDYHQNK